MPSLPCPLQGISPTQSSNLCLLHLLYWEEIHLLYSQHHLGSPILRVVTPKPPPASALPGGLTKTGYRAPPESFQFSGPRVSPESVHFSKVASLCNAGWGTLLEELLH